MKRPLIVIAGSTVLVITFVVWIYLFLFGSPKSLTDSFSNIRLAEPTEERPPVLETNNETSIPLSGGSMVQLTTRATAGFVHLEEVGRLRYAERGTGHVYEIDLTTGSEERIDSITKGKTVSAHFSPNGKVAILVYENNAGTAAIMEWLDGSRQETFDLPNNIENIYFADSNVVRWTSGDNNGTTASEMNLSTQETKELWQIPLAEVRVTWGENLTVAVNKPSPRLRGGVYKVEGGQLTSLFSAQHALSAVVDPLGEYILVSYFDTERQRMRTDFVDTTTGETVESALSAVPEKCAVSELSREIWCALSGFFLNSDRNSLNRWYEGNVTTDDDLWLTELRPETLAISSLMVESNEPLIDITDLNISPRGDFIFFRNKLNDSLWMYKKPNSELGI